MQICSKCGKNRADNQFRGHDRGAPSSAHVCLVCRRNYMREYHREYRKIMRMTPGPRPNPGGKGLSRGDRPSVAEILESKNS